MPRSHAGSGSGRRADHPGRPRHIHVRRPHYRPEGTSPAVGFPPGYGATLAATVAATTLAAVLAALIARRDALVAIPVSLGLWAITGASVVAEGLQLGHAGLTGWGWILVAASVIAAVAGMLLAAHRGPARQPPASYRGPEP